MDEKPGMFATWTQFALFLLATTLLYSAVGVVCFTLVWAVMEVG